MAKLNIRKLIHICPQEIKSFDWLLKKKNVALDVEMEGEGRLQIQNSTVVILWNKNVQK